MNGYIRMDIFVLLLEDLAPARCSDWMAGCSLEQAEFAIRQIAEFHATWWESPALSKMSWLQPPSTANSSQSQERYRRQWQSFLNKMAGKYPDELLAIGDSVGEHYISIMQQMQDPPRTIIHNDYQLAVEWLEHVSDEQYEAGLKKEHAH